MKKREKEEYKMMSKTQEVKKRMISIISLAIALFILVAVLQTGTAEPEGATLQYISNTTKASTLPSSRTDDKGTITTILLSTVQQNLRWKAYVGNVSGTLVLRDADDYSIYEWPAGGSPDGEVYITRNDSIDWASIQCANDTEITSEQTALGHSGTAVDNINNTFADRIHEAVTIGELTIAASQCKSLVTWVNNTQQTQAEDSLFQEVLLMDADSHIVYAALMDQDTSSFKDDAENTTYDFQAIVPDSTGATISTYYFYVEIDG